MLLTHVVLLPPFKVLLSAINKASLDCFFRHIALFVETITQHACGTTKYLHSPFNTLYLKVQCSTVRPPLVIVSNNSEVDFQQVAVGERLLTILLLYRLVVTVVGELVEVYDFQEKGQSRIWQSRTSPEDLWMYPLQKKGWEGAETTLKMKANKN